MGVKVVDLPTASDMSDDDYVVIRDNASLTTLKIRKDDFFKNPPLPDDSITSAMFAANSILKEHLEANARIDVRVSTSTNISSLTVDVDTTDMYTITAQGQNLSINQPTGTPTEGQALLFRIRDNGSARSISWNSIFRVIGVTLPTATVANKLLYVATRYNSTDNKYDIISVGRQ